MRRTLLAALAVPLLATTLTAPALAGPTCFGRAATIVGTDDDDEIEGTRGPDVIYAGGGRDDVRGRGGDDLVCGGAGIDHLHGDGGEDRLDGGPGHADDWLFGGGDGDRLKPGCSGPEGDLLEGGLGPDRLLGDDCGRSTFVPGPGDDFVRATPGEITFPRAPGAIHVDLSEGVATGEGTDDLEIVQPTNPTATVATVVGTEFDDRLNGGPEPDSLQGGAGDDVIEGRGGSDRLDPYLGSDTVSGGAGDDVFQVYDGTTARGGRGDDMVFCEPRFEQENAEFSGGAGDDWIAFVGLPAEGVVDLGAGTAACEYTYDSGPVPTTVVMELALDDVENVDAGVVRVDATGSDERNVLRGGRGHDVLRGAGGDDEIYGENGRDEIRGGAGDDRLLGGTFDDRLFGEAGDDFLDGQDGTDSVDGGDGRDRCSGETQSACEDS